MFLKHHVDLARMMVFETSEADFFCDQSDSEDEDVTQKFWGLSCMPSVPQTSFKASSITPATLKQSATPDHLPWGFACEDTSMNQRSGEIRLLYPLSDLLSSCSPTR